MRSTMLSNNSKPLAQYKRTHIMRFPSRTTVHLLASRPRRHQGSPQPPRPTPHQRCVRPHDAPPHRCQSTLHTSPPASIAPPSHSPSTTQGLQDIAPKRPQSCPAAQTPPAPPPRPGPAAAAPPARARPPSAPRARPWAAAAAGSRCNCAWAARKEASARGKAAVVVFVSVTTHAGSDAAATPVYGSAVVRAPQGAGQITGLTNAPSCATSPPS